MNENGDVVIGPGVRVPDPSDVIVTEFALVNVFPVIVIGVEEHVVLLWLLSVTAGGNAQPQANVIFADAVVHPLPFFTVMVCTLLTTFENTGLLW